MARRAKLVDQFGRPMAFHGGGRGQFSQLTNRFRNEQFFQGHSAVDFDRSISAGGFHNLVAASRWLFQNSGSVYGALQEQADFSFPLTPVYTGADNEWGKRALDWLLNWHKIQNIKGPDFDRSATERLRMQAVKVDGDFSTVFVTNKAGYPLIQHIRAHRIHDGRDNSGVVLDGRYRGARIFNGVIKNKDGRTIAYRVQTGDNREDTTDVSFREMQLSFRPLYSDSGRGITHLITSTKSFSDIFKLRDFEMRSQHMAASIGIIENNDTGGPEDEAAEVIDGNDATGEMGIVVEEVHGGTTRYIRSNSGGSLTAFDQSRPSTSTMDFEARILNEAFFGLGWTATLSLDLSQPGGPMARAIIQKLRKSILGIQKIEVKAAFREDLHGLSNAIRIGELPEPSDGRIFDWKYNPPKVISIDTGNDRKLDHEAYKLGLTTRSQLAADVGKSWTEDLRQREEESRELLEVATRIKDDFSISLAAAVSLIEQRTPNPDPIAEINGDAEVEDGNMGSAGSDEAGETGEDIDPRADLKAEADTYGILVRAGAVTPQIDDEGHFRAKAGLPGISSKAGEAWSMENDVRRPITISPVRESSLNAETGKEDPNDTDDEESSEDES